MLEPMARLPRLLPDAGYGDDNIMKCKALLPMTAVATIFACSATIVPALLNPAAAQQHPVLKNVIPEAASMTIQANITAINPNTREITLQGPSGKKVTVTAGPIVRLEMLKVGDTVNAKYYRSVAFDISGPKGGSGTPKSTAGTMQAIEQRAEGPGGVAARVT